MTFLSCRSFVDVCDLPKETGPCRASMPRFYYNQNNQRCEEFTYGGCRGNGNNFKTQIECEKRCNSLKPGTTDIKVFT